MPVCGRGRCGRKAATAHTLTTPASTNSSLQLHLSHGKKRPANSHNENATTEVDAANRCGRVPAAPYERPGVRAHRPASGDDILLACSDAEASSSKRALPLCSAAADLRVRRHVSSEIERSDSPTRVRAPRSVADESAVTARWQTLGLVLLAAASKGHEQSEISRRTAPGGGWPNTAAMLVVRRESSTRPTLPITDEFSEQLSHGSPRDRVFPVRRNLGERFQHEAAITKTRMWHR